MKEVIDPKITPATRDFIDAADVKGMILYRKDGIILTYLRVHFYNLDLLEKEAKRGKAETLTAEFKDDGKDFSYFSLPREIDLDRYKQNLKSRYREAQMMGKRHIVSILMEECADLTTSGENFEHQHYIRVWKDGTSDRSNAELSLKERITDFHNMFSNVGIKTTILGETEIVKLCNLFGNSLQAPFAHVDSTLYTPILT